MPIRQLGFDIDVPDGSQAQTHIVAVYPLADGNFGLDISAPVVKAVPQLAKLSAQQLFELGGWLMQLALINPNPGVSSDVELDTLPRILADYDLTDQELRQFTRRLLELVGQFVDFTDHRGD